MSLEDVASAPVETPAAPVVEKPAEVTPAIAAPKEPESYADKMAREDNELNDDLRSVFRKNNASDAAPVRGPDGKFAPKAPPPADALEPAGEPEAGKAGKAAEAPAKAAETAAKPAVPLSPVPAPANLPKELVDKFAAAPPELQSYLAKREADTHKAFSDLGRQVKALEPVAKVIEANRATFDRNGTKPEEGIAMLINAQNALDQNPESGIAFLAKTYGVDLRQIVAKMYGETDNTGLPPDPEIMSLKSELTQMKRQMEFERSQQAAQVKAAHEARQLQERTAYESRIDAFAKDRPDFYAIAPEVMANVAAIQQSSPNLSTEDVLAQAYERAIWANPRTREAQLKDAQAKQLAEAARMAEQAKRAGSINVRGQARSADPANIDDDLRAIFRKHNAR